MLMFYVVGYITTNLYLRVHRYETSCICISSLTSPTSLVWCAGRKTDTSLRDYEIAITCLEHVLIRSNIMGLGNSSNADNSV